MCRLMVYKGSDEILLSKLILEPTHSILKQSFDSRLRLDTRRGQNNADGFGIGFYTDAKLGSAPCLFTSIVPAWNCTNLHRIASKTASRLIFGHVRATSEGSLSEDNCHPFTHGCLMWMHNGGLGGWKHIKRRLGQRLADKWYLDVKGGTDSEWAFSLFLNTLEQLGYDPDASPKNGFGPNVLRRAVEATIAQINELTDSIPQKTLQDEQVDTRSLLNFAVTDGQSVICTRYISSSEDEAASLYYSSGTQWITNTSEPDDCQYHMARNDKGADIVLVASEPLTFERENWVDVPTNSILTIHRQTVMVHPIIDKFYRKDPYHVRSSAFVQEKGLVSNFKLSSASLGAAKSTPQASLDTYRKMVSQAACSRGRSPGGVAPQAQAHGPMASDAPAVATIQHRSSLAVNGAHNKPSPAQGNIKVKRQLVAQPAENGSTPVTGPDASSDNDEPASADIRNPRKLSQYFPELTLAPGS